MELGHRDRRLPAECSLGREAAIPEGLISFFQKCVFQAIEQEIAVKDRHTLAVALGRLGDPRIVVDLRLKTHPDDHPGYVQIPAGTYVCGDEKQAVAIGEPFWLSKYPVTNSQYALFIEDGGYSRQEFWSDEGWRWVQNGGRCGPKICGEIRSSTRRTSPWWACHGGKLKRSAGGRVVCCRRKNSGKLPLRSGGVGVSLGRRVGRVVSAIVKVS